MLLEGLNKEQKEAANYLDGALLVLAGAGSGKTRVLTYRIAKLLEKGHSPYSILAITFTNKAAGEMKDRVAELVGCEAKNIWISTFHSACVRILRTHADKIGFDGKFNIYDSSDSEKIVKEAMKELDLSKEKYHWRAIKNEISSAKDNLLSAEEYIKENSGDFYKKTVGEVYKLYQSKLFKSNSMDFDDLIYRTVKLFEEREDVLDIYQNRLKYVMVDEYQDTNYAQYRLVSMLSGKYGNLCVVGDDDQSIYSFRGANIRNILDFEKDFPTAKTVKLEQNYRSNSNILNLANDLIKNNNKRKSKKLWTEKDSGEDIVCYNALDEYDEANFVYNQINDIVEDNQLNYSDMAILYRTNAQSRVIEDILVRRSVSYRIYGGLRFYERMEIKDLLAYLKIIANPFDDLSVKRIINVPKRGIGSTSISRIEAYANEKDISFLQASYESDKIKALGARANGVKEFCEVLDSIKEKSETYSMENLVKEILDKSGYLEELENEDTSEANTRIENLNEFIARAIEYDKNKDEYSLTEFLEEIALVADIDNYEENTNSVSLMTLHSSKGLEFPLVFLVGLEDGLFPGFRSLESGDPDDIEEERRLFYVGITRAKDVLRLSHADSRMMHGKSIRNIRSRFIEELSDDSIEFQKNKIKQAFDKHKPAQIARPQIQAYKPYQTEKDIRIPKNIELNYDIGDRVKHRKFGIGDVLDIQAAGADFEVTVEFEKAGEKKLMAALSKLKKAE